MGPSPWLQPHEARFAGAARSVVGAREPRLAAGCLSPVDPAGVFAKWLRQWRNRVGRGTVCSRWVILTWSVIITSSAPLRPRIQPVTHRVSQRGPPLLPASLLRGCFCGVGERRGTGPSPPFLPDPVPSLAWGGALGTGPETRAAAQHSPLSSTNLPRVTLPVAQGPGRPGRLLPRQPLVRSGAERRPGVGPGPLSWSACSKCPARSLCPLACRPPARPARGGGPGGGTQAGDACAPGHGPWAFVVSGFLQCALNYAFNFT